ncbi:MAG: hypothetical protein DMG81_05495 [Acidobacteria bacterium]|nr:MAG: hypothetical protein DMG81_05495 [Acidobacteriota bacterium]
MGARPAASSGLYIPSLDGMRAIAFFIVFVAHAQPFKALPGGFGVTIFFFLSGYLITSLLREEARKTATISLKGFYLRRVLRIFPPCYLTVVFVSTLAATGVLYNRESYASLVSAFLYFSNYWNILGWGNLPAGLGILWSLAVEEHYYLLFPLLYWWFVRRGSVSGSAGVALLSRTGVALFLGKHLRRNRYSFRLDPGGMCARHRCEFQTRRSCAMADEARFRSRLGRRDPHRCLLCLSESTLPRYRSLHLAGDRTDADLLLCDIAANELRHTLPGMARVAAPGAAFLHHVSDPPHALSPLLSLLPAKPTAGGRDPVADHRVCTGYADVCGTSDPENAQPVDAASGRGRNFPCEPSGGHRRCQLAGNVLPTVRDVGTQSGAVCFAWQNTGGDYPLG